MNYSIDFLKERENELVAEINSLERKNSIFSICRFFVFLIVIIFGILSAAIRSRIFLFLPLCVLFFVGFVILCFIHYKSNSLLKFKRTLRDINSEYIARVKGDFSLLKDKGNEFIVPNHDYCVDLDIFGDVSLFSLLNVSESAFGRKAFANELLNAHTSSRSNEEILKIQEAVHELSEDIEFLQEYQALARQGKLANMPMALLSLSEENESFYPDNLKILTWVLISLWIIPLVILFVFPRAFVITILGIILINLITSFILSGRFGKYFKTIDGISRQCDAIYKLFEKLETKDFKSELIKSLICDSNSNEKISVGLKELSKVCMRCSFRSQPLLALVLNALCLFDSSCAYKLNNWAMKYGKSISENINKLGIIESLMSSSVVEIVFEEACKPEFVTVTREDNGNAFFKGDNILHPLLNRSTAVANSVEIESEIAIITGSNMSGKTTLIRTVGIMCVLSYLGAYVPAKHVTLGRMRIVSSMRIVDSLKEEMSTFKAELVRISAIVNAGRENKPLLFLIDEIFRGTNSADRTSGAMEVLKSLSRPMVIGFMTTHDYALCDEAKEELKNITYFHFSEKYDDDGITFDYKLKYGMTKISNAKQLMKLVGIIL